jgi:spore coat protein U-like protein
MKRAMQGYKILLIGTIWMIAVLWQVSGQQFQLKNVPNRVSGTYSLDTELIITATFSVRHRGSASEYFVTFSTGGSGTFYPRQASGPGGGVLAYQIYDTSTTRNILKDLSGNPAPQEVLHGSFPDDNKWVSEDLSFVVIVPSGQFPPAGTYSDTVSLTLYQGTLGSYTQQAQQTFQVRITMPSVMELSLVPPGAPFSASSTTSTLDFGILEIGKTQAVDVVVRSNQGYSLFMVSQYGNVLRIVDPTDTSTVPVRVSLNGNPIALSPAQAYPITASSGPTSYGGVRYSFVFTVDTLDFPTAGNYSCVITFTLQAQ